jgi:hypothetical protein
LLIEERLNPGEASQYGFAKGERYGLLSPDRSRRIEIHPAEDRFVGVLPLRRPQVCIYDNKNGNIVDQFFLPMDHVDRLVMTHDWSKLAATELKTIINGRDIFDGIYLLLSCKVVIFDVQKKSVVRSFWLYNKRLTEEQSFFQPYPSFGDMFFSPDGSKLIIQASPYGHHLPFLSAWGAVIYDASTGRRLRVLPLELSLDPSGFSSDCLYLLYRSAFMKPLGLSSDCLKIVNYSTTSNSLRAVVWKDKRVQQKALALACALHERLGAHSPAHLLDPYTLRDICLMGLPADAFGSEPKWGSDGSRCVVS